MVKVWLAALAGALALLVGEAAGSPAARLDVTIPMSDGVPIAATLYVPEGTPPAGGWPAIVFFHGLSGNRQQMNALVEGYGLTNAGYAILTLDARGHGQSRIERMSATSRGPSMPTSPPDWPWPRASTVRMA